jgi:hypothetical protein
MNKTTKRAAFTRENKEKQPVGSGLRSEFIRREEK